MRPLSKVEIGHGCSPNLADAVVVVVVIRHTPSINAAGVRVGSQLDHLREPAWDSALKLVARIIGPW